MQLDEPFVVRVRTEKTKCQKNLSWDKKYIFSLFGSALFFSLLLNMYPKVVPCLLTDREHPEFPIDPDWKYNKCTEGITVQDQQNALVHTVLELVEKKHFWIWSNI